MSHIETIDCVSLFSHRNEKSLPRLEEGDRPAGIISEYVLNKLPYENKKARTQPGYIHQITQEVEYYLQYIDDDFLNKIISCPDLQSGVARDFMFVQNAIGNADGEPGPLLIKACRSIGSRLKRPNTLTYEDCVLNNPSYNPRTFTEGTMGWSEFDFYRTHQVTEKNNAILTEYYSYGVERLERGSSEGVSETIEALRLAHPIEVDNLTLMTDIGSVMDGAHFQVFRTYFRGYPKGEKGASGAFSASPQKIYALLVGAVPDSTQQYIDVYSRYFPGGSVCDIKEVIDIGLEGESLWHRVLRCRDKQLLVEYRKTLWNQLGLFRLHKKAIVQKIPGGLESQVQGTGGIGNVDEFTRDKIRLLENRIAMLDELSDCLRDFA